MYESPIEIIERATTFDLDSEIIKAVKSYGINVNKEQLVRALRYDREQYEKGYADAKAEQLEIIRCKDCKWGDWYNSDDGHRYCYCMETEACRRTGDDFCSYAERAESEK